MPDGLVEVVVGAFGPAFGYPGSQIFDGDQFADQTPDVPWEQRKKFALSVPSDTTLGDVINRAAEHFGVRRGDHPIAGQVPMIYFEGSSKQHGFIPTVEDDGPGWSLRWSRIEIRELIQTAEAGLLDGGDPLRPQFWPVIPQAVFTDVGDALLYLWMLWEHYLAARESSGLIRAIVGRLRNGQSAGREDLGQWLEAFGRIHELMRFLEPARTTIEIATYMGLPVQRAEHAMWAIGFALGEDGRWRAGADPAASVLRAALLDLKRDGAVRDDEIPERMDERLRAADGSSPDDEAGSSTSLGP